MVTKRKEAGRRARESGSHKERWQEVPDKREAARLSGQSSLMEAPRGTQSPSSPPPIPTSGLFCFGDNSEGNLGSGQDAKPKGEDNVAAAVNTPLPLELSLPVRFVAVAAGLYHSLALTGTSFIYLIFLLSLLMTLSRAGFQANLVGPSRQYPWLPFFLLFPSWLTLSPAFSYSSS